MAKTKAELLNEYCELKEENLKLTNTIHQLSSAEDKRRALITKLRQEVAEWKQIARKENDRVVDLAKKLDEKETEVAEWEDTARKESDRVDALATKLAECEKEKTLIKSQRDVLLKEAEEHLYQLNDLQESFDILQAQVRKIQIDEEVIHDQGYEEGYRDARHSYEKAVAANQSHIDRLLDENDLLHWVLYQIHENQTK